MISQKSSIDHSIHGIIFEKLTESIMYQVLDKLITQCYCCVDDSGIR